MRLTFFVVWKSWASNPLRTGLTVFGIALGVAIVVAIHVMDHNTIQSQLDRRAADQGDVDFIVRTLVAANATAADPVSIDPAVGDPAVGDPAAAQREALDAVRADLAARPGVRSVVTFAESRIGLEFAANESSASTTAGQPIDVPWFGLDPLPNRAAHYAVVVGEDLAPGATTDVLVGARLAAEHSLVPGSKLVLAAPNPVPRIVCRDGVPRSIEQPVTARVEVSRTVTVRGVLAPDRLGRRGFGRVVLAPLDLLLASGAPVVTSFHVVRDWGADPDAMQSDLAVDYYVEDARSALIGEGADERAFRNGVKILAGLALLLGMFGVFQTLSQSLVERLRQLGLMRALGASRGALSGIFLVDALAMGLLGAVLGVGLGLALAFGLSLFSVSSLGVGKEWGIQELPYRPIVFTVVLGVFFTMAGAAFPLWKARHLAPLDVLAARGLDPTDRSSSQVLRGVHVFLFFLLVLVLPISYLAMTPMLLDGGMDTLVVLGQMALLVLVFGGVFLASPAVVVWIGRLLLVPVRAIAPLPTFLMHKTLRRNPGRIAASVCGLAVVLMALLALKSITWALAGEIRVFGAAALQDRAFISGGPVTVEELAQLERLPGVAEAVPLFGRVTAPFLLSGMAVDSLVQPGGVFESKPELARTYVSRRGLIVSTRLAELRNLEEGSAVSVLTDDGPVAYQVLAVSDQHGFIPDERAYAMAAPAWMRNDFCIASRGVQHGILKLAPDASFAVINEGVRSLLPTFRRSKFGPDIEAYLLRDLDRDFLLFDLLLALILLLAVSGLVNGMTLAALGRIRELGILRALGMSRDALRQSFFIEGLLVAALAAILAVGLGLPLGRIVVAGLNEVAGLRAPYEIPWPWVFSVPLLAIVAGVLAAVLPGRRASAQDPAQSVRYE